MIRASPQFRCRKIRKISRKAIRNKSSQRGLINLPLGKPPSNTLPVQEGLQKQHARPLRYFVGFWIKRRSFHGVSPLKEGAANRGLQDRRSAFKFRKIGTQL
ncbi:hypothetical protein CEXT_165621 [Caerostris extrusa]|uniref:Uncharacterized protein n=1 Tax=Caerostris extrusa TaxID=172846 RepID=A0AAV4P555_CAEEX|nr:hypothetical protein CEXT_165621 [Caerostris extrusa]